LPNAGLKIFLTADSKTRALRRYNELTAKNVQTTYDEVLHDIEYRDKNDSGRSAAPLRPAEDAVHIDSTDKDLEQCLAVIGQLAEERLGL
jgi:cytidylate kinase